MPRCNISDLIFHENQQRLDKTALIEADRILSYGQLQEQVEQAALTLASYGVCALHRVALLCHDSIEYIVYSLAVLKRSAAIVPIAPDLMSDERSAIPERMDVHFILSDDSLLPSPQGITLPPLKGSVRTLYLIPRTAKEETREHYADIQPAFIRFSSGTTGTSKGVVLSHETIRDRTDAANDGLQISEDDTVAWVLSMSFHFVVTILLFLRKGATIVLCGTPILDAMVRALRTYPITVIYASPIHYRLLTTAQQISPEDLRSLRLAISTAVRLPPQIAQDFNAKFHLRLTEAYGVIEIGLPFVQQHAEPFQPGHLGKPLPSYDVKCTNDGQVLIRGKGLFDAYFSPWLPYPLRSTAGWFNTGDTGTLSPEHGLTLIGRHKDVINFSGMKIFPQEVEDILNQFPGVSESLVYGEPHPEYGQIPCAKLVLSPGVASLDERAFLSFCRTHLATHKIPKAFTCVPSLPKTASGKIRRYSS